MSVLRRVCAVAGSRDLIAEARADIQRNGLHRAVRDHDDGPIFQWLYRGFNFSGVSDAIAASFLERHGEASMAEVGRGIDQAQCAKLAHFENFTACGFQKTARRCAMPKLLRRCPVPQHDARNGRLAQAAYSLHLFMRDVAGGDFISWLDQRLADADAAALQHRGSRLAQSVAEPMLAINGVGAKLVTMCMSQLLLGGDPERERWVIAGANMIAIDTLVHNFLSRTGILKRFGSEHSYGTGCYSPSGCAAIIRSAASRIDRRRFNKDYPARFPRFVQFAIWRFCAQGGLAVCNGISIDDSRRCRNRGCELYDRCDRIALRPPTEAVDRQR